jgi:crossover junction endodeoxyribonuclease RuvC
MIVGIDPGNTGAVAILSDDAREIIDLFDIPTKEVKVGGKNRNIFDFAAWAELCNDRLGGAGIKIAYVENESSSPIMGKVQCFSFGTNFGAIQAVLYYMGIPVKLLAASKWSKILHLRNKKIAPEGGLDKARELFPPLADKYFKRKKDNGRADAVLIAVAGHKIDNPNKILRLEDFI